MQSGVSNRFYPDDFITPILREWVGCSRYIWNAKINENNYYYAFGTKFFPETYWKGSKENPEPEFGFLDQSYSQFKNKELNPWIYDCPPEILRNTATRWFQTQWKFMRGECGAPKIKHRSDGGSILLTREIFRFGKNPVDGKLIIEIGREDSPVGTIKINWRKDRPFKIPNSITIKVNQYNKWTVSFSFNDCVHDDFSLNELQKDWKKFAEDMSEEDLTSRIESLDVGVKIPVATTSKNYDFTDKQKKSLRIAENKRKRLQQKLAKQLKGSKRLQKTRRRVAETYGKQQNIRTDFAHKTTHTLAVKSDKTIFIFEDLRVKNMTKSASGTIENPGKNVAQKAGLNRAILAVGWHRIYQFLSYKARRHGKIVFKINAAYTSQECSRCGHTHEDNRPEQEKFECGKCGLEINADLNAALTIKNRAIKLLKDSGTELSERGVLRKKPTDERTVGPKSRLKCEGQSIAQPVKKDWELVS